MSLQSEANAQAIPPGLYKTRDGLAVMVVSQDAESQLVVLELPDHIAPSERLQTMSRGIFHQLFERVEEPVVSSLTLVNDKFEYEPNPAVREQLLNWYRNFDWPAIEAKYALLTEKLVHLDVAIKSHEKEDAQMYFMEVFFLFHILGNRLGYPSEGRFRQLHELVFSVVDHSAADAEKTRAAYRAEEIDCDFREITLYDSSDITKAPERYYLSYALKDHHYPESHTVIPKGAFLKARR